MLGGGGIERGRAGGVGSVALTSALEERSRLGSGCFSGCFSGWAFGVGGAIESEPKIAGTSAIAAMCSAGGGVAAGCDSGARATGSDANSRAGSSRLAGVGSVAALGTAGAGAIALVSRCADGVVGAVTSALFVTGAAFAAGAGAGAFDEDSSGGGVTGVAGAWGETGAVAVGAAAVVCVGLCAIAGGALLVALMGRALTASGDNGGVERAAAGGGTRIDGDAGGGTDVALTGGVERVALTGAPSSSSSPASEGTFGAAGTAPSAGAFTASSLGNRTAGMAMLDARRVRAGGAAAMNTSKFAMDLSGVQCCPSGESSSSGVMRPSPIHARSSPLLGRAARVPFGRRTFHGR
ncbi:MAG: hypothetical protein U0269_15735 [Polyangiales bacterium]